MLFKKILSALMSAVLVLASSAVYSAAASDKCIKLHDTTGAVGYADGASLNENVKTDGGVTLIFDVLAEAPVSPSEGKHSRITAFTGGAPYNFLSYDFTESAFTAVLSNDWVVNQETFDATAKQSFAWEYGKWYELAFQFDGTTATAYIDGVPMICAEFDSAQSSYIILYPQFCDLKIDNVRLCSKNYNVRDRYGDVWAVSDISGADLSDSALCFYDSSAYTISDGGRAMPELGQMLPSRTVNPEISGSYLSHKSGIGTSSGIDFSPYGGFTFVWNVRFDELASASHTAVRVGTSHIAGYNVDHGAFEISSASGFGFASSAQNVYASVPYTLKTGVTYELAVRQDGSFVGVYLNGVLMAKAIRDSFASDLSSVYFSNYNAKLAIDELIIAYPDFNVRERTGSFAASFTFDESRDYIKSIWDFKLGDAAYGYSIENGGTSKLGVSSQNAAVGSSVSVAVSLDEKSAYSSFELEMDIPEKLELCSIDSAVGTLSQSSARPLKLVYCGDAVAGTLASFTVKIPVSANAGDTFKVTAKLSAFSGDVPLEPIVAEGTLTAVLPELPTLPTGLTLTGNTLSWDAAPSAASYKAVISSGNSSTELAVTAATSALLDKSAVFPESGEYVCTVYALDKNGTLIGKAELSVIRDDSGTLFCGLDAYKASLTSAIDSYIAERSYTDSDMISIEKARSDARLSISAAADYKAVNLAYTSAFKIISAIPTKSDRENSPRITVSSATAENGTVTLTIALAKNPGIVAIDLYISYDADSLTLTSVSSPLDAKAFIVSYTAAGQSLAIVNITAEEYALEDDADIVTLEFSVAAGASGNLCVTAEPANVYDSEFEEVTLLGASGIITAEKSSFILGDANMDGVVSLADATAITRNLSSWDVAIDKDAADVDGDGSVTLSDALLISRKLNNWDVQFTKQR